MVYFFVAVVWVFALEIVGFVAWEYCDMTVEETEIVMQIGGTETEVLYEIAEDRSVVAVGVSMDCKAAV